MLRKLLIALAILAAILVWIWDEVRTRWSTELDIPADGFVLTIDHGDSLRTVVDALAQAGVVPHPDLMVLYGRWTGVDQQIKRGEYRLSPGLNAKTLLAVLQKGDVIRYQVTLPEGISVQAALDILSQQSQLDSTIEGVTDRRILQLIRPHKNPEGLFFPDSYQYVRGDTDWSILQRAYSTMRDVLDDEWEAREEALPYATPYEALIMASIIERETGLPEERGQIAGVFVRRLQRGMLLQTDPTVIYGLGPAFDGNLKRRHLSEEDNAYNTYRRAGLPPTPIALPGRGAIHAALHPEPGTALYFVARGDGGHVFSDTLSQHNEAVREYQLKRRKDYTSSPRVRQ
ncbi:MAG: endolytic transglycosylase MltG [Halioglobus sp.]|nr:endolytic transglycosylase MltG [Halioglobus sp.]